MFTLNFVAHVHCTADGGSAYFDVGVEVYDDFKVIDRIRKISDTTVDKLTFTVSTTICCVYFSINLLIARCYVVAMFIR